MIEVPGCTQQLQTKLIEEGRAACELLRVRCAVKPRRPSRRAAVTRLALPRGAQR
jgi:hypothetical protein